MGTRTIPTTMSAPSETTAKPASNAFRSIRDMADATDAIPGDDDREASKRRKIQTDTDGQQVNAAVDQDMGDNDEQLEHPVEEIESYCMECGENGTTKLLLTMIPFFKEVIIMSFRCPHCGFNNSEIQSAGQIQELGSTYTVKVTTREDLNRQLVKSEYCTVTIPEYELTLPPGKGQLTTIESIVSSTVADLALDQPVRQHTDPETHAKIEALLAKLRPITDEEFAEQDLKPFTVKLEDPSGNSFIEAVGGLNDVKWSKREFKRTAAQNEQIGLAGPADASQQQQQQPKPVKSVAPAAAEKTLTDDYEEAKPEEVFSFPDVCSSCGAALETYMKTVDIPHFKEVVLMSTNCHTCGYRDNEIKSGGAIAPQGRRITLKVEDSDDLSRDILKSETAGLTIPEIDLHLHPGTLGGRFTTLEGLLNQIYEELDEKVFAKGDSAKKGGSEASGMEAFLINLKKVMDVSMPFSVVLDDPLSNSYIQNLYAPDDDPNMDMLVYDRSHDQNEELGLNDIQVEGYHGEEEARVAREKHDADMAAA